jgi:hypothetical protein
MIKSHFFKSNFDSPGSDFKKSIKIKYDPFILFF